MIWPKEASWLSSRRATRPVMPCVSNSTPMREPSRSMSLRRFLRSSVGSAFTRSTQTAMFSMVDVCRAWRRSAERVSNVIEPSAVTTSVWKKQ